MFVIATVRAQLSRELERLDRVSRLTGLRDSDDEVVLVDDRVAVEPLARDIELDRHARPLLDDVAPDDAGVIGGPACDKDDPAEIPDLVVVHAESLEDEAAVAHTVADRLRHGLGLLVISLA
jgi:hypothetical protein